MQYGKPQPKQGKPRIECLARVARGALRVHFLRFDLPCIWLLWLFAGVGFSAAAGAQPQFEPQSEPQFKPQAKLDLAEDTQIIQQIYLRNGDRLSGELIAEDDQQLVLKTPYHAKLTIAKAQIVRRVDSLPEKTSPELITAAAGADSVAPIASATAETNAENSTATTAENSAKTAVKQPWQLDIDVSAAKRSGKETSESITTSIAWEWRDHDWRYSSDASFDYEIKQEIRKTHKYAINPVLDYFYSEQIFGRAKLDFSYNYLASDYKNIDVSIGPGFSFFRDQQELRLELMALVGVKNAYFRGDQFLQALLGYQDSVSFRFASLDYDYQYEWPNTGWEWYAKGSYLTMLDQPIALLDFAYEWRNDLGVRYWLTDKIRLSWSVLHEKTAIDLVLSDGSVYPLDVRDIRQKLSIGASF